MAAILFVAMLASASGDASVGRIYSYVRSNRDGSEAEAVHVYRASPTRIEVTKMRERCTNAAFVTAELDLAKGQATRLTGGSLRPGGGHEDFAWLSYDPAGRRIVTKIASESGPIEGSTPIADEPWHLFDFDFASLTVTGQYRKDRRANFSFGLPLVTIDGGGPVVRYLGRADARFAGEEEHEGRMTLRFEVGGPALGAKGGPMWFDAEDGHIVDVAWGLPNHAEYRDFRLRLTGIDDGGAETWKALLVGHHEGCGDAKG